MDFDKLRIGSIVTVIDEDLGINVKLNVVGLTRPDIQKAPHELEVTLASKDSGHNGHFNRCLRQPAVIQPCRNYGQRRRGYRKR